MTSAKLSRSMFLALALSAGLTALAPAAHAAANPDAERYVQENATAALRALNQNSGAQRRQTFNRLMANFADMPRIAQFVLGRYGGQLRTDPQLRQDWISAFQEYAIAVYEVRLQSYSGTAIRVTGSVERIAGRDVIVNSELQPIGGGRPLPVQWRLLRTDNSWKAVDVSLILEGNQIWLAQQQQRDFLAQLDRSNGDIRALISNIRGLTASMREQVMARN